jgi:5-amino-6-(5-phosphoribosylamino)uracil reductase
MEVRMTQALPFSEFVEFKTAQADDAELLPLETIEHTSAQTMAAAGRRIGNAWTRRYYDGDFMLPASPDDSPAVSLVFVESSDGNTGAANPEDLGGGPTDKHFIYEGLSRVAADAVLAGASSAKGRQAFFSVWRSEIVALRRALGLPRHPAQIVVSRDSRLDLAGTRLFNVPHVPVIVLAGEQCMARCAADHRERPWIRFLPFNGNWRDALSQLRRDHGITRISAIGGRTTASSLIDADVVDDLCLTITSISAGEPNTPLYVGSNFSPGDLRSRLQLIDKKRQPQPPDTFVFEHLGFPRGLSASA